MLEGEARDHAATPDVEPSNKVDRQVGGAVDDEKDAEDAGIAAGPIDEDAKREQPESEEDRVDVGAPGRPALDLESGFAVMSRPRRKVTDPEELQRRRDALAKARASLAAGPRRVTDPKELQRRRDALSMARAALAAKRGGEVVPGVAGASSRRRVTDPEELQQQQELLKYEALEAGQDILPATEEMLGVKHRSAELRATRLRLQAEMDRLDDEAQEAYQRVHEQQRSERERLDRLIHEVDVEESELTRKVKLAIGPAAGIDSVATWKSVPNRNRRFDPEWLKADDPELFEEYRTAFDSSRFRREEPAAYEAHMRITTHRVFEWVDEMDSARSQEGDSRTSWSKEMSTAPEIPLHGTVTLGSAAPTLKATTEKQRIYLDPTEAVLLKLLDDVERGYEEFFIIERLRDTTGETYIQVTLEGRFFVVEYRDGGSDNHFKTLTQDKPAVVAVLNGWSLDMPGWNGTLTWTRLVF